MDSFSVTIRQNGVSEAFSVIVTEKHREFCGTITTTSPRRVWQKINGIFGLSLTVGSEHTIGNIIQMNHIDDVSNK